MAIIADDLGAWLVGLLADAGRRKLVTFVLGDEQERALHQACRVALIASAADLCAGDATAAEQIAMVVGEVFTAPGPQLAGEHGTLLEALRDGIAARLAVLDDRDITTEPGWSSADALGVSAAEVTQKLTSHLLREVTGRGVRGGPLEPLANQLGHGRSFLLGLRLEGKIDHLDDMLVSMLAVLDQARPTSAANAAASQERLRFRLPRVVARFTGRDNLLAELDAALSAKRIGVITQAISGMGGVGKTQLAAAYMAAHHREFDIAAWVRAEDGGIADLADMAVALALPAQERTPPQQAGDTLVFLSNTERSWLLVLDNVDGPRALAQLPTSGNGRILVTSRHRGGYEDFGAELNVDVFDADTARQYLLARSGRTDEEATAADAVAAALGYLPLALAHAGAYCAFATGIPFADYLELLQDLPSQELFSSGPELFYQHAVTATWNTSITAAEQQAPLARQALEMMAYVAPEGIPRSFFSTMDENSPAGSKRVADALAALHRYSLATVSGDGTSVHRLLQKVIRDQLTSHEQATATSHALTAIKSALPDDPHIPATWSQWQELAPHVTTIAGVEAAANLHAGQLVPVLDLVCQYLLSIESPLLAMDLATRAVAVSVGDHVIPQGF